MSADPLVVVNVQDLIDSALTGHGGCAYQSPPQPCGQALILAALLLGRPHQRLGCDQRWSCPIAGGRRTVTLVAADGAAQAPEKKPREGEVDPPLTTGASSLSS
jgi:hypothetical protein